MSFPSFSFLDIVNEEWDDSSFKEILETKYLFVFFKYDENNILRLNKVKFWNMKQTDILEAKKVWDKVKNIIKNGEIVHEVVD
jgi:hypothetical protein